MRQEYGELLKQVLMDYNQEELKRFDKINNAELMGELSTFLWIKECRIKAWALGAALRGLDQIRKNFVKGVMASMILLWALLHPQHMNLQYP